MSLDQATDNGGKVKAHHRRKVEEGPTTLAPNNHFQCENFQSSIEELAQTTSS